MDMVGRSSCRLPYPSAQPMYAAAERWRDEALLDDRSLFDDRPLDVRTAGQELVDHFINNPDLGTGSFITKLKGQLGTASADTVQVAAELLYAHFLIVSTRAVSSRTKTKIIDQVVAFRESGTSGMPQDLAEALRGGAAHPGQAFNNYRWKMLNFLISFYVEIKALPMDERRAALYDRSALHKVFDRIDPQTVWSQMWAVEHLLFPDVAPPMLNRDDRAAVVSTWPDRGSDVAEVLTSLEPNVRYGSRAAVLPYRTPYREQWKGPEPALHTYVQWGIRLLDTGLFYEGEIAYKLDSAERLGAAIEAAIRAEPPYEALRKAMHHPDFNLVHFYVVDDFLKWVKANEPESIAALGEFETADGAETIDRFLSHVPRIGQLKGAGARISLGSVLLMSTDPEAYPPWRDRQDQITARLTKGYRPQESATEGEQYLMFLERMDLIRAAMAAAERPVAHRLGAQSLAWMVAQEGERLGWAPEEYAAFDAWRTGKVVEPPSADDAPVKDGEDAETADVAEGTLEGLGARLSFAPADLGWLEETIALLLEKRQIIFQGPPGTGKTFIARAVAQFVVGHADRVRVVQFHPSYSYEDFVAGLRPDPDEPSHFRLVPGPLTQLAEQARANPAETYVLLIDEINRANVPAVFGELYYLLEYRDDAITMTYGGEAFSLPENLLIIGTMNTADRSITALDSAMRRRFYVRDLRPGDVPLDGILRGYLDQRQPELLWRVDLLDYVNEVVDDPDLAVGPSHFMAETPTELTARRGLGERCAAHPARDLLRTSGQARGPRLHHSEGQGHRDHDRRCS